MKKFAKKPKSKGDLIFVCSKHGRIEEAINDRETLRLRCACGKDCVVKREFCEKCGCRYDGAGCGCECHRT